MIHYLISERGNFDTQIFRVKIDKAIQIISDSNNVATVDFEEIERSNKDFLVKGQSFLGQHIKYKLSKDGQLMGHLECFIDNDKKYIEIFTSS